MKSKWNVFWVLAGLTLVSNAGAGDKTGNGGGAWVCRETTGQIRWARLVDLFEAQSEWGLTIESVMGDVSGVVDQVQARLRMTHIGLYQGIVPYLTELNDLKESKPKVVYTTDRLEFIDDSLYRLRPNAQLCAGGVLVADPKTGELVIPYEQVVNTKSDDTVLVQSDLMKALSTDTRNGPSAEVAQAALVMHEAVYDYLRAKWGDVHSNRARLVVGVLFSTRSNDDVTIALQNILATGSMTAPSGSPEQCLIPGLVFPPGCVDLPPHPIQHLMPTGEALAPYNGGKTIPWLGGSKWAKENPGKIPYEKCVITGAEADGTAMSLIFAKTDMESKSGVLLCWSDRLDVSFALPIQARDFTRFGIMGNLWPTGFNFEVLDLNGKTVADLFGKFKGWNYGIGAFLGFRKISVKNKAKIKLRIKDYALIGIELGKARVTLEKRHVVMTPQCSLLEMVASGVDYESAWKGCATRESSFGKTALDYDSLQNLQFVKVE